HRISQMRLAFISAILPGTAWIMSRSPKNMNMQKTMHIYRGFVLPDVYGLILNSSLTALSPSLFRNLYYSRFWKTRLIMGLQIKSKTESVRSAFIHPEIC